jgi:hypothetical protein
VETTADVVAEQDTYSTEPLDADDRYDALGEDQPTAWDDTPEQIAAAAAARSAEDREAEERTAEERRRRTWDDTHGKYEFVTRRIRQTLTPKYVRTGAADEVPPYLPVLRWANPQYVWARSRQVRVVPPDGPAQIEREMKRRELWDLRHDAAGVSKRRADALDTMKHDNSAIECRGRRVSGMRPVTVRSQSRSASDTFD